MTSLGRSPLRPKELSKGNSVLTAGVLAAEIDAEQEPASVEAPTTDDDDSYEIDVDGPSYDEPAVRPATEVSVVAVAPVMAEPKREKLVRTPKEPKPAKAPKAPKEPKPAKAPKERKPPKTPKPPKARTGNSNRYWTIAAGVIGTLGLLLSVVLATGALFVALDAGQGGSFFANLSDACDALVGPLKGVFSFSDVNADKKEALVGWGLGSVGYLLVGRFVQSILLTRVKN